MGSVQLLPGIPICLWVIIDIKPASAWRDRINTELEAAGEEELTLRDRPHGGLLRFFCLQAFAEY